jgi:hypothetical protein
VKTIELLARPTDLSTFLVKLTRRIIDGKRTALQNLIRILEGSGIEARHLFGTAWEVLKKANQPTVTQNCVCFTETLLGQLSYQASRDGAHRSRIALRMSAYPGHAPRRYCICARI